MKWNNFMFLGLCICLFGVIFGYVMIPERKISRFDSNLFSRSSVHFLNKKSKKEFPIDITHNEEKTILVYINPFCFTRAQYLEDWHKLSMNINDRVVIILTGEMIYYIDYLVRIDKRYDKGFYLLKHKNGYKDMLLKDTGTTEAVFIIENNREIIGAFQGPGIPSSLMSFLNEK